ncbi:hypothetical protein EO98_04610 [Methanosarcina sp. 2.H.T.1A.6]|uniref:cohesin domain-containing protein n=1 Tax=unclassified Methanosarcina TaxID=2644672 RepID=UPI0006215C57|nr:MULTISPECIES: cohesin domain-containing protein [unclassified Methanosarcina]KKG11620.1 hypothetical protein EO97_16280 [Methanosarcina sp. 2.H.T.1A.15]KKG15989.1 hypothetical protein EO94_05060 [Methanosarcina sp. 2.H.T.1A.3]KKG21011.1 hypothetical protein EO96_06985 [Methanosarcina sp. 2.H.T.1A.8]KKG21268.1 hypothetical protein EO98_04610 [Methanosarcina sp. 2.H.T.1A.6]
MRGNSRKGSIWLVAVIAALTIFTFTFTAAASQVTLQPSSRVISAGDMVTLDVFVVPDTEIAGMQFDLGFDGSVLLVTNVTEGDLFKQSGRETFFNSGQADNGTLKNVYGCVLGKGGISTSGTFATVTLSSNSDVKNTSEICLKNVVISGPDGNAVEAEVVNASIKVLKTKEQESFLKKLFRDLFI